MKKINKFLLLLVISSTLFVSCEKEEGPSSELVTLSFEELSPGNEGYWNGADGSGEIKSGELIMTNNYTNGDHPSWDGFSYSNLYDTETAGFGNQYSVFNEVNGENNFLVFTPSYTEDVFATFEDGAEYGIKSIKLCNNTYAALSMKNGDVFGKKFGGDSGEEEDWFKVTISGYDAAGDLQGEVDFYLADFRESGVANDYIISEWTEVDLSSLGEVNKITLSFNSSDVGNYGVNTPKYVCVDDIIYEVIADL